MEHALTSMEKSIARYDQIPQAIQNHHTKLSGRALASLDDPRDYLSIEPTTIIANLAACMSGKETFRFNTAAFVYRDIGPRACHFWNDSRISRSL